MVVYNISNSVDENLTPGLHYNTGTRWQRLRATTAANWFYMPTIELEVTPGTYTVDLFYNFNRQFSPMSAGGRKVVSSRTNISNFKQTLVDWRTATDFYFYVILSDDDVFSNVSITENGILEYTIKPTAIVSERTFMNIIFVERN
jgi:hypothetical protein